MFKKFIGWIIIVNIIPLMCVGLFYLLDNPEGNVWLFYKNGWIVQLTLAFGILILFCVTWLLSKLFN